MPTWIHSDRRGPKAIPQAIARALYHKWSVVDDPWPLSDGDRIADLRALIAATAWTVANLAGAVEIIDAKGRLQIDGDKRPTKGDRLLAARALERTWEILTGGERATGTWATSDGLRALPIEGTAGWPAIAALVLIGVGLVVGGYLYGAKEAESVANKAAVDADMAMMLETQARVLQRLNAHAEEEKAAGRPLPLRESTKAAIDALLKSQEIATKGLPPPLGVKKDSLSIGLVLGALIVGALVLSSQE